jgi:hypothetical protein
MSVTEDFDVGPELLETETSSELRLDEFLPLDAVEDDLEVEPEAIEPKSVEEQLHTLSLVPPFDDETIDAVDVDAITAALGSTKTATAPPHARTEVSEELDAQPPDLDEDPRDHELTVDEVLDATTHADDPAREHDWVAREPDDRAVPTASLDEHLADPHHGSEFVCVQCFLARPAHQRIANTSLCVDCAPDGDPTEVQVQQV